MKLFTMQKPLFDLGSDIKITPLAWKAMETAHQHIQSLLARHSHGDWGNVREWEKKLNGAALKEGGRILSRYPLCGSDSEVWVVTIDGVHESSEPRTLFLLPQEWPPSAQPA